MGGGEHVTTVPSESTEAAGSPGALATKACCELWDSAGALKDK